ncbi:hypothetical protein EJ08DRAFT_413458 [Tothia fuscella]|uniref:NOT2/NOT3/NOT5 C-terminal domain-containing protein n=1 Tax=Tothia fuscella TaxID=1048955 RepID=A0A9P4NKF1_9PEZI|nr:hypothetical protein EJ08DRAFT_413458 [Tothia fuscella]
MFTQNENRRVAPASGRLQNGKIGGADASWYGMSAGNAPGLSTAQSRTTTGMPASFAQTIVGQQQQQQQHRPLDLAEFPSLGGGAQPQQNAGLTAGGSYWSSNGGNNVRPRSPASSFAQRQAYGRGNGRAPDDAQSSSSFAPGADGYHFGARPGGGSLAGLSQQSVVGPSLQQSRLGLTSPATEQADRTSSSIIGEDRFNDSSSRTIGDSSNRAGRTVANPFPSHQDLQAGPIGYQGRTAAQDQVSNPDSATSPPQQQGGLKRLSDMSPDEVWGMPGLMTKLDTKSLDFNEFARGIDINQLGLNLDSTEQLINTFGSALDERPVIPEFTVPSAYYVNNVPSLVAQMQSFTDETLIMIFYLNPRDMQQENAANALVKRDWRWHTELRQWMQKDPNSAPPVQINDKQERGWYVFFDVINWRRERREFVLDYDLMHPKMSQQANVVSSLGLGRVGAAPQQAALTMGQFAAGY